MSVQRNSQSPLAMNQAPISIHVQVAFARGRLVDALLAQTCAAASALRNFYRASATELLNQHFQQHRQHRDAGSSEHVSR